MTATTDLPLAREQIALSNHWTYRRKVSRSGRSQSGGADHWRLGHLSGQQAYKCFACRV